MALADLRALARAHRAVTRETRGEEGTRSGQDGERREAIRGFPEAGTPGTRGTRKIDNVRQDRRPAAAIDPTPLTPLPEPGTPERARIDSRQAAMLAGLDRVAQQRPPSWANRFLGADASAPAARGKVGGASGRRRKAGAARSATRRTTYPLIRCGTSPRGCLS